MGLSLILAITELAPNQVQAFATVNDMLAALEAAENSTLPIDTSDPLNYVLAELDFVRYKNFVLAGHVEDFSFEVPETVNGVAADRVINVFNMEAYYVTVVTTAPGESITLPPFSGVQVRVVGADVFTNFRQGGGQSLPYPMEYVGDPGATSDFEFMRLTFALQTLFAADWLTPGVGNAVFTAQPDDADTITINDGLKSVTFEFESGGGVGGGNTAVTIGGDQDITLANLARAINAADINVEASYDTGTNTATIYNLNGAGGSITATNASPDFTVQTFLGGRNGGRGTVNVPPTENCFYPLYNDIASVQTQIGVVRINPFGNHRFCSGLAQSGSILFNAQVDDGDQIVISDGIVEHRFEFESGGGVTAGYTAVTIGADQDASATNLRNAIMFSKLNVEARFNAGTDTISLLNHNGTGGSVTKVDADNDMTVTNFSGGTAPAENTFDPGHALLVRTSPDTAITQDAADFGLSFLSL